MVLCTLCPGCAMPPRGWREPRRRRGTRQEQDDEDAEWEDESDWLDEDGQERGISGRNGTAEELPEGWECSVCRGSDRRFKVEYVSRDGTRIKSKTQLRIYLFDLGITGDTAEELVQKADFSQKFARKFILLNSSSDQANDGDTSRDELIAMAMQASFDQQMGLSDDSGEAEDGNVHDSDYDSDDPDYDWSGESEDSHQSVGDVAAGGWRRRQSELEQETAEDYDVSCLETKTLSAVDEGSCPVCQCDWETGDQVRILPCQHQFHTKCIDQWLKQHRASCPLCKKDVREDWEDEEEEVWDPVKGSWTKPSDAD